MNNISKRHNKGKSVYVFLLSNNEVKIGVSSSVKKRIRQIETLTRNKVLDWYATAPFVNCYAIEKELHEHFKDFLIDGQFEYFNVPYQETVDFVKKYTDDNGKIQREYVDTEKAAKQMIAYFHPELEGF